MHDHTSLGYSTGQNISPAYQPASFSTFDAKKDPHCELGVSLRATSRARAFQVLQRRPSTPRPRASQNHSTQDSRVVPHRGTNWAALRLTAQIGRDAVLSESYGRGY